MPMGVVSDSEFESQLHNTTQPTVTKVPVVIPVSNDISEEEVPVISGEVVDIKTRGRGLGDVNVPNTLRALIAGTAHIEGREEALKFAHELGISPSSVSAYTKGATSCKTYNQTNTDIVNYVKARKARVTKKALRVMTSSLDKLTPEKLDTADAKELSGIAKDMSAIIGNFNDTTNTTLNNNGPTFVLYAPQVHTEDQYHGVPSQE